MSSGGTQGDFPPRARLSFEGLELLLAKTIAAGPTALARTASSGDPDSEPGLHSTGEPFAALCPVCSTLCVPLCS